MCGIVGVIGPTPAQDIILDGLRRLEYRGYDSAGIAVDAGDGTLATARSQGKLDNLVAKLAHEPLVGTSGIGHTRWATHGRPSEDNAHPHRSGSVAVVHNGIIENHVALKAELTAKGYVFHSDTDTEVIAHLIADLRLAGYDLAHATFHAMSRLVGAYAIVVLDATEPGTLVGARLASPLVVGLAPDASYLASDVSAILTHTRDIHFLDEGEIAVLTSAGVALHDARTFASLPLKPTRITWTPAMAEKGGFKHFMLKEIYEQPRAVADTLRGRVALESGDVHLPELGLSPAALASLSHVYIVACGTSWHAGLVGRYLFEDLAGLAVHVEYASEFRYRQAPIDAHTLVLAISQSGETADTLAAIRMAKAKGATILSICNVIGSSIPRESQGTVYTHAGPEIGVASTKAFTTQLVALHLMALHFGRLLGRLAPEDARTELEALLHAPALLESVLPPLTAPSPYEPIARRWRDATSMLFLGRGPLSAIALEGALKLKEISYIHAEGQPAGEMKHGPIALIDERVPTVILNPKDAHFLKVRSNLAEIHARSGPIILVASADDPDAAREADHLITLPAHIPEHLLPLIASVPMQLLAYTVADFKGTDVDQPRNLAKSVTVE